MQPLPCSAATTEETHSQLGSFRCPILSHSGSSFSIWELLACIAQAFRWAPKHLHRVEPAVKSWDMNPDQQHCSCLPSSGAVLAAVSDSLTDIPVTGGTVKPFRVVWLQQCVSFCESEEAKAVRSSHPSLTSLLVPVQPVVVPCFPAEKCIHSRKDHYQIQWQLMFLLWITAQKQST